MERAGRDEAEYNAKQAAAERARLTEPQLDALKAIVGGRLAWSSAESIYHLGHAPETVAELIMLELVDRWGKPHVGTLDDDYITLSTFGAWLMQVQILERVSVRGDHVEEDPYWAPLTALPQPLAIPTQMKSGLKVGRITWADEITDKKAVDPVRDAEYLMDPETGAPLNLFGVPIVIDPKLAKGERKAG